MKYVWLRGEEEKNNDWRNTKYNEEKKQMWKNMEDYVFLARKILWWKFDVRSNFLLPNPSPCFQFLPLYSSPFQVRGQAIHDPPLTSCDLPSLSFTSVPSFNPILFFFFSLSLSLSLSPSPSPPPYLPQLHRTGLTVVLFIFLLIFFIYIFLYIKVTNLNIWHHRPWTKTREPHWLLLYFINHLLLLFIIIIIYFIDLFIISFMYLSIRLMCDFYSKFTGYVQI